MSRAAAVALTLIVPTIAPTIVPTLAWADGPAPATAPLPTVTVPPTWTEQPTVAAAARAAMSAGGARSRAVAAWGQPSLGCFATAIAIGLAGGEATGRFADELRAALGAGLAIDDWGVEPGELRARISRAGWRGEVRAHLPARAGGRAEVVACFYNDRAPTRCAAACDAVLAAPPPAVTP